jgi:hypothetical protein
MNKEFIPYKQALELKELGFDEPCLAYYNVNNELTFTSIVSQNTNSFWLANPNNITSAPLYQQSFRWFRDKYKLFSFITSVESTDCNGFKFSFWLAETNIDRISVCNTYEEAELECLKKLIEIAKNK